MSKERFEIFGDKLVKDNEQTPNLLNNYLCCVRLNEFVDKIADLETKLAESEKKLKSSWYEICPRCGNPYGASQFVRENGEVICSNCMKIEDIYEPLINQLEDQNDRLINQRDNAILQLDEKEKEIVELGYCVDFYKSYLDSFQEKVADELIKIKYEVLKEIKNMKDKCIFANCIDNQIKQLKGEK